MLIKSAQALHHEPFTSEVLISKRVKTLLLANLDEDRLYLTDSAINALPILRINLSNTSQEAACEFVLALTASLRKQLNAIRQMALQFQQTGFDYRQADTVGISLPWADDDNEPFASDQQTLQRRWYKWFKFNTLLELYEALPDSGQWVAPKLAVTEPLARRRVHERLDCRLDRFTKHPDGLEGMVFNAFLSAIAEAYDPHSSFFSMSELEQFEASLSTSDYSFGLDLREESSGEAEISNLMPGGPAWKSGQLHEGDIVTAIRFGSRPAVQINCANISELIKQVHTTREFYLEVTIRKQSGEEKTVRLLREKIQNTDNQVSSFILRGLDNVGYIALPSFYTDWENDDKPGCSADVARAIIRLSQQDMKGMILDLRNNGGGSMQEAISLTGIFVDYGTLGITKHGEDEPELLKDANRGVIFDGPLIIMVNRFSASAAEVLASALKDHQRALIVGSTTYGKATAQLILPIGATQTGLKSFLETDFNMEGFTKLTVKKLYSPSGNSHQGLGVEPDIHLPHLASMMTRGESSRPFALPNDQSPKKGYFKPWNMPPPVEILARKSQERLQQSLFFQKIRQTKKVMDIPGFGELKVVLTYQDFPDYISKYFSIFTLLQNKTTFQTEEYKAIATEENIALAEVDKVKADMLEAQLKELESDQYLEEAYRIMLDWIQTDE